MWIQCDAFNFIENAHARSSYDDDDDDNDDSEWKWGPPASQAKNIDPLHHEQHTPHPNNDVQMADDLPPPQSSVGPANDDHMPLLETNTNRRTPPPEADIDSHTPPPETDTDNRIPLPEPNPDNRTPPPEPDANPIHDSPPVDESMVDDSAEAPAFDNDAHLTHLLRTQQDSPPSLVPLWKDPGGFLLSRYGVRYISAEKDPQALDVFCMRFGLGRCHVPKNLMELYESVVGGRWPTGTCDLSEDHIQQFPAPMLNGSLRVTHVALLQGYLVTPAPVWNVDWKIFIQDPLTILQIERDAFGQDPTTLVESLIKKGVPFQILNPQKLEGAQFYDHPGPVVHPVGRSPQHADYLAYRQELARFFTHYPHAYAAALCAGGILWRIAMDVLPPPDVYDITRLFHPNGCFSRLINGEKYWTPQLTVREEDVISGVYKWAICKSDRTSPLETLDSPTLASSNSPMECSWWPKHQAWSGSGLDFGAWAPFDEDWYAKRSAQFQEGAANCIRVRNWKSGIKYQEKPTRIFLQKVRTLTDEFVRARYP